MGHNLSAYCPYCLLGCCLLANAPCAPLNNCRVLTGSYPVAVAHLPNVLCCTSLEPSMSHQVAFLLCYTCSSDGMPEVYLKSVFAL